MPLIQVPLRLYQWLSGLFRPAPADSTAPPRPVSQRHHRWPTREHMLTLPWFDGLPLEKIIRVETDGGAHRAFEELSKLSVVGFDTESKPMFKRGETSDGPHVAQFATPQHTFVFTLHQPENRRVVGAIMALESLTKVGFGLRDDIKRIRERMHVTPHSVLDVETLFAKRGYGRGVGVKVGVALVFKRRFRKSKRIGTSNWNTRHLSDQQLLYAANDAYAALRVYEKLENE